MRESSYKTFSWRTHKKNWFLKRPNVCQFELTFRCDLHCRHCYTDGYNQPAYLKKELKTPEIKLILDKVYKAGVIWLCFTGGDPLVREDFLDIYSYAKDQGFIISIFTNGCSMTEEIAQYFAHRPPFAIEMTLNAVSQERYEKISQAEGSFEKAMRGINLILRKKLSLKIKTEITKDNFAEAPRLKKFLRARGLKFQPSYGLHARLNGDSAPCDLRISPPEILALQGGAKAGCLNENKDQRPKAQDLFRCAIGGGDSFHLDPYGNTFPCNLIREPKFSLLRGDVPATLNKLSALVRGRTFLTRSKCSQCNLRGSCQSCPGRAVLEKKALEAPIEYHCELAKVLAS